MDAAFPRSQTPFGNALFETPFRVARSRYTRETEFRGSRSQTEFGNEGEKPKSRTLTHGPFQHRS